MEFRYQIYDRDGSPKETGEIEASDHWEAIKKLDHHRPTDSFPGGMHWCTLVNVTGKKQHHVFPDGKVIDRPINVQWHKG